MEGSKGILLPRADECRRAGSDEIVLAALAAGLALTCLATKYIILASNKANLTGVVRPVVRLLLVSTPDLAFVAGLAGVCWLVVLALRRRPRLAAAWRWTCVAVFALAGAYAVASVPMFYVTMGPFSIRLIVFAGGPGMLASSVKEFLPAHTVAGLIGVPAGMVVLAWAVRRWARFTPSPRVRAWAVAVIVLALFGAASGHIYKEVVWFDPYRWERRAAQSPHAVLLVSCVAELLKDKPFTYSFSFSEIDDSDFRHPAPEPAAADIAQEMRPKNVLFIVLESTPAEYLSLYGAKQPTTPQLERLAREQGLAFDNVYAPAPASWKSLLALMASIYDRPDWRLVVRDYPDFAVPTLPEVLREHGYRTCFLHAGRWDWRGGEEFLRRRGAETVLDARQLPEQLNSWGSSDRAMFRQALSWIDEHRGEPFFVCACTIQTHHPYPFAGEPIDFGVKNPDFNRYLNALHATDAQIAWLIDELARRGLDRDTLVVVTADHGECFGQHGQHFHGFGLHEPNIHVPLVLLHRSLADRPRRDAVVRQHIDVAPTVLDLLGIPAPAEWQGRSMLDPGGERRAYFCSVANQIILGLRDGRYKYHYYVDSNREELFDLASDPGEETDLAAREPERTAEYRRRIGGFVCYQREFIDAHSGTAAGKPAGGVGAGHERIRQAGRTEVKNAK